jgi:amidase
MTDFRIFLIFLIIGYICKIPSSNYIMKNLFFIILLSLFGFESYAQNNNKRVSPNLLEIDIESIQKGLKENRFTSQMLVNGYLERINKIDKNGPKLNSMIYVNPKAMVIAKQLDAERLAGKIRGPLHGIPILLKDNIDTHDMPTTAGSRALENSYPLTDSYLVAKLKEAGAIIIGKTNLSEWANFRGNLSSSGWSGLGGQTLNPYDVTRSPCGSSAGSGVAIAANLAVFAIGTETNGSIICPSTTNGLVGIKPTVGLISRSGVIPISYTQDTPGPMARTVRDAAIALGTMVGVDKADDKTKESEGKYYTDYTQFLNVNGLKGKRIGLLKGTFNTNYKADELMNKAVSFMKANGAEIIDIEKISQTNQNTNSFEVMVYEYKAGLNKYFNALGPTAKIKNLQELIDFNKSDAVELLHHNQAYLQTANEKGDLNSAEYLKALNEMLKYTREEGIDKVMADNKLDAIIAHSGGPAAKIDLINGSGGSGPSSSSFAAHAGYPNITVPMGFVEGLPVGISFFGKAWSEPKLIEIAYAYEQGTKHRKAPKLP